MTAIHVLLVVALVEVAINRVAVPMLRPDFGEPPLFHVVLDYVGLFFFYFTGALAAFVIVARAVVVIEASRAIRDRVAQIALAVAALAGLVPLVVVVPDWVGFVLEVGFGVAVIAVLASVFAAGRDLGVQIGLPVVAFPLVFHTLTVLVGGFFWPEDTFYAPGSAGPIFVKVGVIALALAALATPYCFAPRPFARAVTKPAPIVVAMSLAALGAVAARLWYPPLVKITVFAIGVDLNPLKNPNPTPDPKLALYLLALATLAWTLTSCALAASAARRQVGIGLALVLLGGYAFTWPHHYLLPLLGLALIADSSRRVREEELEAMPIVAAGKPIADQAWSAYVGALAQTLRRTLANVHSLTTRGEGGFVSSLLVGDVGGIPVRTRIERLDGSVIALDIVVGIELDEARPSAVTVWTMPPRGLGANPPGPPASPIFKTGDAEFDTKFRVRGSAEAFAALFDDTARAKALTTLDGWLAYWEREGLRYRVYPGRGAPLDHPLPLSDLALDRAPATTERLGAVVELLAELGARVLQPPPAQPEPDRLPDA